jgi:hypothetical protein
MHMNELANKITDKIFYHVAEDIDDIIRKEIEYEDPDASGDDFETVVTLVTKNILEALYKRI